MTILQAVLLTKVFLESILIHIVHDRVGRK